MPKTLRLVEEISISDGAAVTPIELPLDRYIEAIVLSVRATVDTLNATGIDIGSPWSIIKNLAVSLRGTPFISVTDAHLLAIANRLDAGVADIDQYDDTDDASQTVGFDLEIPLSSLAARVEGHRAAALGTLLPAHVDALVRNLTVKWTWGAAADLAVGGTVDTELAGTCRVLVRERGRGDVPFPFAFAGRMVQGPEGMLVPVVESRVETWTAESSEFRIRLPRSGMLRRIVMELSDNGTLNDDDINSLEIVYDGDRVYGPVTWSELRRETLETADLVAADLGVGLAAIDWNSGGDLSLTNLIDAEGSRSLDLVLDVATTTAGRLRLMTESYRRWS